LTISFGFPSSWTNSSSSITLRKLKPKKSFSIVRSKFMKN
jgi:hypothetical protein